MHKIAWPGGHGRRLGALQKRFFMKLLTDGGDRVSKRHLKDIIFKIGRESLLASCAVVDTAPLVAMIGQKGGWEVVWDAALSRGGQSIRRLQLLVKALCHHCTDDPLAAHMLLVICQERP